jgi:hypothetical protein
LFIIVSKLQDSWEDEETENKPAEVKAAPTVSSTWCSIY